MKMRLLALALSAAFVAACGKKEEPVAQPAPAPAPAVAQAPAQPAGPVLDDEKVLNIYNWPDYIPEGMLEAFEKETGIKVNYDTFETNEALHAKLVAGNTGYDIVVPGSVFAKPQIEAGLFQPLDKSKIPNYGNLDAGVMKVLERVDPGNQYLVPWAWSFTTVGINKNKVEKALGGMPMPENAWDLVFDPKYTAKLKSCGIAYLDSPSEIIPVALHYIGKDAYSNDPADYKAAVDMLKKVRKDIRIFSSTMIDDIASGKACAVIGWAGDINIAAARAAETGSKDEIVALLPSTGALAFFDTMAILKDAKHPNNAHAFINFYLKAENAAAMANEMGYNTGNTQGRDQMKPEVVNNPSIFPPADYMPKLIQPSSYTNEAREAMASAYNAFKRGK
ncbi:extracellular solute-binding protein [Tepidimonas taiwanensis]|uniref:extracellular solute-binding protein n=1 Tax=Tepidimonas taiwanensis TaxID=307486 RepID=UPI0007342EF5|nr:extracellular solute-binding protein [Tepidimonas taiwanensis]